MYILISPLGITTAVCDLCGVCGSTQKLTRTSVAQHNEPPRIKAIYRIPILYREVCHNTLNIPCTCEVKRGKMLSKCCSFVLGVKTRADIL